MIIFSFCKNIYVTINKDKEGKERLDNNGNRHAIIVIRDVVAYEAVPLKSLTLDDIAKKVQEAETALKNVKDKLLKLYKIIGKLRLN